VRVGGELRGGKDLAVDELPNAELVAISLGSVLSADATRNGPGGTVITWADLDAAVYGETYARPANGAPGGFIEIIKGGMRAVTGLLARRNAAKMTVAAPTATIGIRGTHFGALFCNDDCAGIPTPSGAPPANGLHVDVADGRIVVSTPAGSTEYSAGQFGYVRAPSEVPVQVPPEQGTRVPLPRQALDRSVQGGTAGEDRDLECRI
jgi:hypothetical protein